MQIVEGKIDPTFQPMKFEILIESPEELATLWLRLNTPWGVVLEAQERGRSETADFCLNAVSVRSFDVTSGLSERLDNMVRDYNSRARRP